MTTTTAAGSEAGPEGDEPAPSDADDELVVPADAPAERRNRAGVLAGIVVFLYALFLGVEVVVAGFDHRAYNRLHELQGNVFARVALGLVVLSAIFHGLNGLRLLVADVPAVARRDASLRSLVAFATFALAIPAAAVILWPSISELFR